ncbi:MAG TPA: TlyA family RNA methyltransferase [Thermoleophilaceae bacterium]|nr:TlyA family RNA methyltransferase [Thermoleophilaceae bacterium]
MAKRRLDALLADRGLYESRSRAAAAVIAGEVRLAPGGQIADKPGRMVADDVGVQVAERPQYVSRGGVKLANALDAFGLDVAGRRALDAGASTGGFTDCLLQRGAEAVVAADVAYGELHWSMRQDERVTVLERTNVKELDPAALPWPPDLIVADLSFISLHKVLPALMGAATPVFDCLVMIKPQFEVGRQKVGKGGVVRDPALRREALVSVGAAALRLGASVMGYASSGLPGPKGNRESFVWLAEAGRPGALHDLDQAVLRAEP